MEKMKYLLDPILISYPKSGRTWLRMILANIMDMKGDWMENRELFFCRHWFPLEAKPFPKKIIYLERDPRDTIVSHYFEKTKRMRKHFYEGTISEFIRSKEYGIKNIYEHRRSWNDSKVEMIFRISYEGLKKEAVEPVYELLRICGYETPREIIKGAVDRSTFDRMREMEMEGRSLISGYRGRFGYGHKEDDPESFRCRKGKVGGYKDYLSEEDLKFIQKVEERYAH